MTISLPRTLLSAAFVSALIAVPAIAGPPIVAPLPTPRPMVAGPIPLPVARPHAAADAAFIRAATGGRSIRDERADEDGQNNIPPSPRR